MAFAAPKMIRNFESRNTIASSQTLRDHHDQENNGSNPLHKICLKPFQLLIGPQQDNLTVHAQHFKSYEEKALLKLHHKKHAFQYFMDNEIHNFRATPI